MPSNNSCHLFLEGSWLPISGMAEFSLAEPDHFDLDIDDSPCCRGAFGGVRIRHIKGSFTVLRTVVNRVDVAESWTVEDVHEASPYYMIPIVPGDPIPAEPRCRIEGWIDSDKIVVTDLLITDRECREERIFHGTKYIGIVRLETVSFVHIADYAMP